MFDDNIRLDAFDDCIVNLRLRNGPQRIFSNVDFESYRLFIKSSILQPNLIKLLNPLLKKDSTLNLYYEKIRRAERYYQHLMDNQEAADIQIHDEGPDSVTASFFIDESEPIMDLPSIVANESAVHEQHKQLSKKKSLLKINVHNEDANGQFGYSLNKTTSTTCMIQ